MINFSPPVPDVAPTLQTLTDMLALLSSPEKSAARVAELQANTAALQQATADHKKQLAAFVIAEADHKALLAQQSADAAEKLAAAQAKFDDECKRRSDELAAREANAAELQNAAANDAKVAAALRTDLDRRLKIIRSASG